MALHRVSVKTYIPILALGMAACGTPTAELEATSQDSVINGRHTLDHVGDVERHTLSTKWIPIVNHFKKLKIKVIDEDEVSCNVLTLEGTRRRIFVDREIVTSTAGVGLDVDVVIEDTPIEETDIAFSDPGFVFHPTEGLWRRTYQQSRKKAKFDFTNVSGRRLLVRATWEDRLGDLCPPREPPPPPCEQVTCSAFCLDAGYDAATCAGGDVIDGAPHPACSCLYF